MTDKEWADRIREIRRDHGIWFAIRFARIHGFLLSWVLHVLYPHHHQHPIIFPF